MNADDTTITHHLIAGVAHGSIHPSAFTIWLQLSKSASAIALALTQQNASSSSAAVRRAGIKQFGKSLASSSWRETWDGLGGAEGVARVVGECLSVNEVAEFARTVGRCGGGEEERRGEVAALVKALGGLDGCARAPRSSSTSDGGGDGGDDHDHRRPLSRALAPLAQACPAAFVEDALARGLSTTTTSVDVDVDDAGTTAVILSQLTANGPGGGGGRGTITQRHPAAVQAALHRALFDIAPDNDNNNNSSDGRRRRRRRDIDAAIRPALLALLHGADVPSSGNNNDEAAPPNFSPSMHFSLRVLRSLASAIEQGRPHAFPPELFVSDLVEPLLRRCRQRQRRWPGKAGAATTTAQVREIVALAATCLAAWPEAAGARVELDRVWGHHGQRGERRLLVHWAARLWARGDAGGGFEGPLRALVRAAVVGVVVGPGPWRRKRARDVAGFLLEGVERGPARYAWLRLCLQEAGWGDLDDDGDLEGMRVLGWDRSLFLWLEAGQALVLFERLRACGGFALADADLDHLRRDLLERKGDAEQVVGLATKRESQSLV
ncbi:hypothetical protein SLS54_006858 [Diplodia seriata]